MVTEEDIKRDYVNANEASQIINVNNSRIRQICIEGKFEGAFKVGDTWLIPRKAVGNYSKRKRGPKPKPTLRETITNALNEATNLNEVNNDEH